LFWTRSSFSAFWTLLYFALDAREKNTANLRTATHLNEDEPPADLSYFVLFIKRPKFSHAALRCSFAVCD
jgi:hypothetical protein